MQPKNWVSATSLKAAEYCEWCICFGNTLPDHSSMLLSFSAVLHCVGVHLPSILAPLLWVEVRSTTWTGHMGTHGGLGPLIVSQNQCQPRLSTAERSVAGPSASNTSKWASTRMISRHFLLSLGWVSLSSATGIVGWTGRCLGSTF